MLWPPTANADVVKEAVSFASRMNGAAGIMAVNMELDRPCRRADGWWRGAVP